MGLLAAVGMDAEGSLARSGAAGRLEKAAPKAAFSLDSAFNLAGEDRTTPSEATGAWPWGGNPATAGLSVPLLGGRLGCGRVTGAWEGSLTLLDFSAGSS